MKMEIQEIKKNYESFSFLKIMRVSHPFPNFSNFLFKREVFGEIAFLDEKLKLSADTDLFYRALKEFDLLVVPEFLLKCYIHDENLYCGSMARVSTEDWKYLLEKYVDSFENNPVAYSHFFQNMIFQNMIFQNIAGIYMGLGKIKLTRRYFLKVVRAQPTNLRAGIKLLTSFLRQKFYFFLADIYHDLANKSITSRSFGGL